MNKPRRVKLSSEIDNIIHGDSNVCGWLLEFIPVAGRVKGIIELDDRSIMSVSIGFLTFIDDERPLI